MTYLIEKDVPTPSPRAIPTKNGFKYPFAKMKVGDSFFSGVDPINRISVSLALFHKKNPTKRFTCRKVEGGARIWRIK